jgi:hypothetical protein
MDLRRWKIWMVWVDEDTEYITARKSGLDGCIQYKLGCGHPSQIFWPCIPQHTPFTLRSKIQDLGPEIPTLLSSREEITHPAQQRK